MGGLGTVAKPARGSGVEAALFFEELLGACESLQGIAEEYGPRTLAALMYLQGAILTGEKLEVWPGETRVGDVLAKLPSFRRWMAYTELGGIWAQACERIPDGDPVGTRDGTADAEDGAGSVTCYSGHVTHNGVRVQVDFEAPFDADEDGLDAAFLKALGEQVEVDYLAVGTR